MWHVYHQSQWTPSATIIFFEYNVSAKLSSCDTRTVLDYRSADWEGLFKTLTSINLSSLISSDEPDNNPSKPTHNSNNSNTNSGDIDNNWQRWCNCFMDAVYLHIPTKVIKKRKYLLWFDSEVRHLLNKKETARGRAKRNLKRTLGKHSEIFGGLVNPFCHKNVKNSFRTYLKLAQKVLVIV